MNKLFATFVLLTLTFCIADAQDGYIKYHTDSEYRNKAVKVFKGEIVPFINASKANKINVIIGADTITDLGSTSKSFEVVASANTTYNSQKADFLQLKKGGVVWVNVTAIPNTDTVTLISESGKQLTQLIENREVQVNQSELGKTCRLIISNSPTLFYSTENFKQFVESESVQETENTESQTEGKSETSWAWWYYVIIALGVFGLGFGIWIYIKNKKNPNSNEVVFKSGSLTEFADQYGDLDKLSSLNKGIIPTKSEWNKLKNNESAKADMVKRLKGKRIIIKAENETSFGFQDSNYQTNNEQSQTKEWDSPKEAFAQPTNLGNNKELSGQLRQMKDEIIQEIKLGRSGNNNQNEIDKLRNEKTEVENILKLLETDKKNVDAKLLQMQSEKSTLETNLQNTNDEKSRVQNEIKDLNERVIAVEFLKGYTENVFSYLRYCQQVSSDAYNFFNKINQINPEQALVPGQLLMKFYGNTMQIPLGNWFQITQDIKETGTTTNKSLIYGISQFDSEEERKREFQRILYSEVITKYHSSILILAESFRNLEGFQVSFESVRDTQKTFSEHVISLLSKARAIGLETKYVPLFKSFEDYPGLGESVNQKVSVAYRAVLGLEKNSVAEILHYGWKIEDGEEKTQFILA